MIRKSLYGCGILASLTVPLQAGEIIVDGRAWKTYDTAPGDPTYSVEGASAVMKGAYGPNAVMGTAMSISVGDRISYDYRLTNADFGGGNWFGDAWGDFRGGTLDDTSEMIGYLISGRVGQDSGGWHNTIKLQDPGFNGAGSVGGAKEDTRGLHIEWLFPTTNSFELRVTNIGSNTPLATLSGSTGGNPVTDITFFRQNLWDSQQILTISNFLDRAAVPAQSGLTRTWNPGATGNYNDGANWAGGTGATLADHAVIAGGGTATVNTANASAAGAVNLDVGDSTGNGTINVDPGGHLYVANIMRLGNSTGTGTVNQSGGYVLIDNGGTDDLRLGFSPGGTGNYNLSGGQLAIADSLTIGHEGTGVLTISGGRIAKAGFMTLGNLPGSHGTINMTGGTVDQSFGDLEVGDEAVGVASFSGGTFNVADGRIFAIGNRRGGTGTATISGTAVVNTPVMIVGGNLDEVQSGTSSTQGVGTLNIEGGELAIGDDFLIGRHGTGTVTMTGGLVSKSGWIVLGDNPGATGTLNVNGGTINQTFGDLEVGDAGNGTYNQSSGTVNVAGTVFVAKQAGSTGDANVTGGTLNASALVNNGTFDHTGGNVNVATITGAGATTVGPAASLTVNQIRQASLQVSGVVTVNPEGGASGTTIVKTLAVPGKLDLKNNDLLVDYSGASPEDAVRQLVRNGRASGSTNGIFVTPGATADDVVLAIVDNAEWGKTVFNGFDIDADTIVGKYTYFGDSNLDGAVTGDDYLAVDSNLGTGNSWNEGDFNLDNAVTGDDYLAIDTNLGKGTPNPLAFAELKAEMVALHVAMFGEDYLVKLAEVEANGFTTVPEPGALTLAGVAGLAMLRRRRRAR